MSERRQLQLLRELEQAENSQDERRQLEILRELEPMMAAPQATAQPAMNPSEQMDQTLEDARRRGAEILENTPKETVALFAARELINNALGLPRAAGTVVADSAAGVQTLAQGAGDAIAGRETTMGEDFAANRATQREQFPASALRALPRLDTEDVAAAGLTARDVLTGEAQDGIAPTFDQHRSELVEKLIQAREAEPKAVAAGQALGDVATIMTIRTPIARARRNRRIADMRDEMTEGAPPLPTVPRFSEAFRQEVDAAVNSTLAQKLKSAGIKVTEAGLEGALLAAANDDDPVTAAAMTAGGQLMGSAFLEIGSDLFGPKGKHLPRFVGAVAGLTVLTQMFKSATPGDRDRILESVEFAADKVTAAIALGALAGLSGAGRINASDFANRWPAFSDALTTVPRGTIQSFLRSAAEVEGESLESAVIWDMVENPDEYSDTAFRRMQRAFDSDGEISVGEVIDDLRIDPDFRARLSFFTGPQQE